MDPIVAHRLDASKALRLCGRAPKVGESLVAFLLPVALGLAEEVPARVRLFSFGVNETTKGDFYLKAEGATSAIQAAAAYGNDLLIDTDHQSVYGPPPVLAYGWWGLESGDDGLYAGTPLYASDRNDGKTDGIWWLSNGVDIVSSRKMRYISPVFWTEIGTDGREYITEVLNFALTNSPATKNRTPLLNSRGPALESTEDPLDPKQLALLSLLFKTLGTPEGDTDKAIGSLTALSTIHADLTSERLAHTATKAILETTQKELHALKVEALIVGGKLPPALREKALNMNSAAVAACVEFLGTSAVLPAAKELVVAATLPGGSPEATLSPEQLEVAKVLGLTPKQYKAAL